MVWAVERRSWVIAALAMWLAASTHPIEGGLAVAAYIGFVMAFRPQLRMPLLLVAGIVAPFLAPSLYFALRTPALAENRSNTIVFSILEDLPRRGTILLAPFALSAAAPFLRRNYRTVGTAFAIFALGAVALSAGVLSGVPGLRSFEREGGYVGIASAATNDYGGYLRSPDFHSGAVYRVLSPNDREQGAYYLIRHHGVLANELFSESQHRRNWSRGTYQCYLAAKHVDRVVVERGYHRQFPTNEKTLLDGIVAEGSGSVAYGGGSENITVYDITRFRDSAPAPTSVKDCGI
jgi:hypothetical protein